MRRGDEVDVVATPAFELEHHSGDTIVCDLFPYAVMAQREVLAVGAAEIAGPEEDVAGAARPRQTGLLSVVIIVARNDGAVGGYAETQLAGETVDAAVPRAHVAGCEHLPRTSGAATELSRCQQIPVRRPEISHLQVLSRLVPARFDFSG